MIKKENLLLILILFLMNNTKVFAKDIITINQFTTHPALDDCFYGIENAFSTRNLLNKIELKVSNAQGNIANSIQIAKYQASLNPSFMIAISTPSAQANLRVNTKSTLAFIAVTNPYSAGIVNDNTIGVTDAPDILQLLEYAKKIFIIKNIGILYNPGEQNSLEIVSQFKDIAKKHNIIIDQVTVNSVSDIKLATQKLVDKVDIIYIPKDNLVVSAIDSLLQVSNKAKIPVMSNDVSLIKKGVLLAYGSDYFASGFQLGNMIADLIEGKEIVNKIQAPQNNVLKINYNIAQKLGINIPNELKNKE